MTVGHLEFGTPIGYGKATGICVRAGFTGSREEADVARQHTGNPEVAWEKLGYRKRKEVMKHAKKGQKHPDPVVADIADAWARMVLRPTTMRQKLADVFVAIGLGWILGDAGAAGGYTDIGGTWRRRRAARKILAAGVTES